MTQPSEARARDLSWLVALGAALWGTDALFRSRVVTVAAPTLVFCEHLVLVVVLLPFLPRAVRAFRRSPGRVQLAVIGIGAGASALATVLFTRAFSIAASSGDFVTPVVIQHVQPLVAIGGAVLFLHERIRSRFAWFAIPALIGVWLLAFADPVHVTVARAEVVLLALAAAVLWAAGTVLGRFVSASIPPMELTTLRFAIGLPTAAILVALTGNTYWVPTVKASWAVVGLALLPGLLALTLYYLGLRRTAAARATLAELAYPLTGALVGISIGTSQPLTTSQWCGAAVLTVAVTGLSWHEARARHQAVLPGPLPHAQPALR